MKDLIQARLASVSRSGGRFSRSGSRWRVVSGEWPLAVAGASPLAACRLPRPVMRVGIGLVCAAMLTSTLGCGGYGEVSPEAFQYAKTIYNIASRKAESQVEPFGEKIEQARQRGELSPREADWLQAMLDDARAHDWKDAARSARRLMRDQAKRSS